MLSLGFALFPKDASAAGAEVDHLFYLAVRLTGIAFILVLAILLYFLIRYRERPGHKSVYSKGESTGARIFTLGMALIVFIVIDINLAVHDHWAWDKVFGRPDASAAAPLHIQILAQQFAWNVRYAGADGKFRTTDDITTINQLHIPVGRPILLQLKSKDVMHSFFIPNFRVKQDVLPGMITMLPFQAKETGIFDIACSEHCGLGHYRMRGIMTVDNPEAFDQFLAATKPVGPDEPNWGWNWITKR